MADPTRVIPGMDVYVDVFGALRHWYSEVRTPQHQRVFQSEARTTREAARELSLSFVRRERLTLVEKTPVRILREEPAQPHGAGEEADHDTAEALDTLERPRG